MKVSLKKLLLFLSILSIALLIEMDYDWKYNITILLPITYFILILLVYRDREYNYGPCSKSLMAFYGFRMCILPVICAYGNFWLEADKSDILRKYNYGIMLICLECFVVLLSLTYFCKKNKLKYAYFSDNDGLTTSRRPFFVNTVWGLTFIFFLLFFLVGQDYFHFVMSEMDEVLKLESTIGHSGLWYLEDFIGILFRPLISFFIVGYYLKNRCKKGYFVIALVIIANFVIVSDRRIFSLLISGTCIYYILSVTNNKKVLFLLNILLGVGAIAIIYVFLFFQINSGGEMLSRTVQHYFSGPSLNAMALLANDKINYTLSDFFKLMHNTSYILCYLFSSIPVDDGYEDLFGFGAWTPMFMGGIRYFGILSILFLVYFVKFVVSCDKKLMQHNDIVFKFIYLFLGVCMSCYMIMYTLPLIIYFLLSTNLIYRYIMGDLFKSQKKIRQ